MQLSAKAFPADLDRNELVRWAIQQNVPLHEVEEHLEAVETAQMNTAPPKPTLRWWFNPWLGLKTAT